MHLTGFISWEPYVDFLVNIKFHQIASSDHGTYTALKPLCQTRWTVRQSAIRFVLTQYDSVLTSLGEMADNSSPSAATANGLQQQFSKGNTVLGLVVAEAVELEN